MEGRSEGMQKLLKDFLSSTGGHPAAWGQDDICAICGNEAKVFKDDLSCKEYMISRMCQDCQDKTFG